MLLDGVCSSFRQMLAQSFECTVFSQVSNTALDIFLHPSAQCIEGLRWPVIQAIVLYQHVLVALGQLLHCLIQPRIVRALPNQNRLKLYCVGIYRCIQTGNGNALFGLPGSRDEAGTVEAVVDDRKLGATPKIRAGIFPGERFINMLNHCDIAYPD